MALVIKRSRMHYKVKVYIHHGQVLARQKQPPTTLLVQQIQFQGGGGGGITELQETFTTEPGDPKNFRLSQLEGTTDYFPPTTMMGKTKNFIQE